MNRSRVARVCLGLALLVFPVALANAQTPDPEAGEYRPTVGQAGKDVVWVPTPESLVQKMLDKAKVTSQDYVVDLGSGDGRNVIAAAKRGARALGVEYNPDMVALSRRNAEQQGVSDKATFVEGDMYAAEFSDATVLALFLLPQNMLKLREKFFNLKPGSRIVANTFGMEGWEPDEKDVEHEDDCTSWCTVLLWIVPAKVEGMWRLPQGELQLTQDFQMISGSLSSRGISEPLTNGRLRGNDITFTVGSAEYAGVVNGGAITGTVRTSGGSTSWSASRVAQ
jgi:SAM-dependent methyltransferase